MGKRGLIGGRGVVLELLPTEDFVFSLFLVRNTN